MFIEKLRNYIDQRLLKKYIDNKHWQLADDVDNRVTTLLKEEKRVDMLSFYSQEKIEEAARSKPTAHAFFLHNFTRYCYRIADCWVDPDYNWVILSKSKLFRYSYPLVEDPWDAIKPRPSLMRFRSKRNIKKIEKGILVKYLWTNYYHFFVDTLAQLRLADEVGIPKDVPILVPHNFDKFSFVREFMQYLPLGREIIVQPKGVYFQVGELYVAKDIAVNDNYCKVRQEVIDKRIAGLAPEIESPENIFITRKKGIRRNIINSEEIEQVAAQKGFTVVEPGNYTWVQQVKLFSNAKNVIGAHGAGLTNIMFCAQPHVKFLELFPGNGVAPEHYRNMAMKLGIEYHSIKGEGMNEYRSYRLSPEVFSSAVDSFFSLV